MLNILSLLSVLYFLLFKKTTRKKKSIEKVTSRYFRQMLNLEKQKYKLPVKESIQSKNISLLTPQMTNDIGINTTLDFTHSSKPQILNFCNNPSVSSLLNDDFISLNDTDIIFNEDSEVYSDNISSKHNKEFNIENELRSWVLKFKVNHNSANHILKIIKSAGIDVPKDIRTLMKLQQHI